MTRWLAVGIFSGLFLWSLSLNSIKFSFSQTNQKTVINGLGIPIEIDPGNYTLSYVPQQRYTSQQFLLEDRGKLITAITILKSIIIKPDITKLVYPLRNNSSSFILYNPFRTAVYLNDSGHSYRLEINVPDANLELWKDGTKTNSSHLEIPWIKLVIYPLVTSIALAGILSILVFQIKPTRQILPKSIIRDKTQIALIIVIMVLGTIGISYIFSHFFKTMPGFGDEMNYLVQAKIFASGKVYIPEPSLPEFFRVSWMDLFGIDRKIWNFHPIGNSLILSLGWLVGIKSFTVPIVGGLILATQYLLAYKITQNYKFSLLHILVLGSSHYFLSLASSYMAHAPSMLFLSLASIFIVDVIKNHRQRSLIYSAIFMGAAFLVRPLSAVLAFIVPGIWLMILFIYRKINIKHVLASLLIGGIISAILFLYTFIVSGRFAFPYLVKGPEIGQTISIRLKKPLEYKLSNLYRNANEFQNRAHSFGLIGNYVFFCIPAFFLLKKSYPGKKWIAVGYLTFFVYLTLHSWLHWYGWKWEPRMIYDISFIYFLLLSYGIWFITVHFNRVLKIVLFTTYAILIIFNLRNRFDTEYANYNITPTGVRETIARENIHHAIIFFGNELVYAPYSPENSLTFDGDIIYAISQGEIKNYELLAKYPGRGAYYTPDGNQMTKMVNFYERDDQLLTVDLQEHYADIPVKIIYPWVNQEISSWDFGQSELPRLIVVIGEMFEAERFISHNYEYIELPTPEFATPIKYYKVIKRKSVGPESAKIGISMKCYDNISWSGRPERDMLVSRIDPSSCFGQNKSIAWKTNFRLPQPQTYTFYINSDDGSELFLDQSLVIDNNLLSNGPALYKKQQIMLETGEHQLEIKYYNGPGIGFLNFGLIYPDGQQKPLNLGTFGELLFIK